jgi:protein subunit release factor A
MSDLHIERFHSGAGGQQQNKHPKNVRVTHIPSGVTVTVRGRNYQSNLRRARKMLDQAIADKAAAEQAGERKAARDAKVKQAQETIRTYHYPRNEVRDHRTGKRSTIKRIMEKGLLDELR